MDEDSYGAVAFTLLLGVFFTSVGVWGVRLAFRLRRHGLRVDGRVVGVGFHVKTHKGKPSKSWHSRVAFTDHLGRHQQLSAPQGSGCPGRVGESVAVIFLPDRPDQARLAPHNSVTASAFMAAIGLSFLAMAIGLALGVLPA